MARTRAKKKICFVHLHFNYFGDVRTTGGGLGAGTGCGKRPAGRGSGTGEA